MVSIIIPVFNEQTRLEDSIKEIFDFLQNSKIDSEVLIVDDGSSDNTLAILKDLKKKYPIKIIEHAKNAGKGAAVRSGVNNSNGEIILFTDIDLSVPIEFAKVYLDNLTDDVDVIIGTRADPNSRVEIKQFWLREMMGEFFTFLSNSILQVGASDFTCGFKMFRKRAAETIFNRQMINRWAFDAESLFIAKKHHFKIKEIPIVWRHRGGSKVRFPMDMIEAFISLIKIRIYDIQGKYD